MTQWAVRVCGKPQHTLADHLSSSHPPAPQLGSVSAGQRNLLPVRQLAHLQLHQAWMFMCPNITPSFSVWFSVKDNIVNRAKGIYIHFWTGGSIFSLTSKKTLEQVVLVLLLADDSALSFLFWGKDAFIFRCFLLRFWTNAVETLIKSKARKWWIKALTMGSLFVMRFFDLCCCNLVLS